LYHRALSQLAVADTGSALNNLRQLTKEERDFAPGWGTLGQVLTTRASSVATDFTERKEAEAALLRALALEPANPGYLASLGKLRRKQQMYLDSHRLLSRAIKQMEEQAGRMAPAEAGELWFQEGLYHEDAYLDARHLVFAPNLPIASVCDVVAPVFCTNFTAPTEFNNHLRHAADLSQFGEDDFERMADAFRKALAAHPTHDGAFRRLAIHLIDRGQFEEAEELAHRYTKMSPGDPWGYVTTGLIYQRLGRDSLAELEFKRGLELLPHEVAAHYRDVSPILPKDQAKDYLSGNDVVRQQLEEILWRKSDPLYLTSENEVRLAHLARVAFADLMFEDPSEGVWGSETEQGVIYVRYGPPLRIWQMRRDASKETSAQQMLELEFPDYPKRYTEAHGGGRWIFWNYGWDFPNFIFQKQLRYRHASHQFESLSKLWEQNLRLAKPAYYRTSFETVDYPVQFARFKGSADSIVELDLYSQIPTEDLLRGVSVDSLVAGIFVFAGAEHVQIYERTLGVAADRDRISLTYSLPLLGGDYTLSLEARAPGGAAAIRRGEVELVPFSADRLALSDLVLARTVVPRTQRPADRRDFAMDVNRRLELEVYDPVAVYWEVYGLHPDDDGMAHYQVTLSVEDVEGGGVLAKVVGALGDVLGLSDDQGIELTYERFVELTGDRVPEYLSIEIPQEEPGDYRVRVQVTDFQSGDSVVGERVFHITGT
jgi:GWxTD domain-containing protein